jgi:hypothetical protein
MGILAHIRSGQIIRKYTDGKGRVTLENGDTVSPPVVGYISGNDRIVEVVEQTVDNSTGPNVSRAVVETVEADRVLRTITITDVPIEATRARMECTPLQGKLALGEANWQKVLDFRDGTGDWVAAGPAPWSMKTTIDSAQTWQRNSNDIAFFQYILNFTDEQVDELFRAAALINP